MADYPREHNGRFTRLPETAERDAEAALLHAKGWTFTRIGEHFGVTRKGAAGMVDRALTLAGKTTRDEALQLELAKLDMREATALEVLARRHLVVSHGKVVSLDGLPLEDDGIVLDTLRTLTVIADQRMKLLGLYAPTRSQVTVTDEMTSEIQRLAAQLGVNDRREQPVSA